jgi:hypothetical protein
VKSRHRPLFVHGSLAGAFVSIVIGALAACSSSSSSSDPSNTGPHADHSVGDAAAQGGSLVPKTATLVTAFEPGWKSANLLRAGKALAVLTWRPGAAGFGDDFSIFYDADPLARFGSWPYEMHDVWTIGGVNRAGSATQTSYGPLTALSDSFVGNQRSVISGGVSTQFADWVPLGSAAVPPAISFDPPQVELVEAGNRLFAASVGQATQLDPLAFHASAQAVPGTSAVVPAAPLTFPSECALEENKQMLFAGGSDTTFVGVAKCGPTYSALVWSNDGGAPTRYELKGTNLIGASRDGLHVVLDDAIASLSPGGGNPTSVACDCHGLIDYDRRHLDGDDQSAFGLLREALDAGSVCQGCGGTGFQTTLVRLDYATGKVTRLIDPVPWKNAGTFYDLGSVAFIDGAVFWVQYSHADNTGSTSTTPPPVTTKIFAMAAR